MTHAMAPRVFDTTTLTDVVPRWEAHNAQALIALACDVPGPAGFRGREANLQMEHVHLARVAGTAHSVRRDRELIEAAPTGAIAVYALMRGDSVIEAANDRRSMMPGQLLICDADRPFARSFGHGLEELAVRIPKEVFARTAGVDDLAAPILIDAVRDRDPYGRALVRLVGRALRTSEPVAADEAAVVELVSVLATDDSSNLALAHRAAAKAFIEEHLADPTLAAGRIAEAIGVSDRTLTRVFAAGDVSVPQYILHRRLDVAYAMLASPLRNGLRASDIATQCGFTSLAYFSQKFRDRFGVTARDLRGHCVR